MSFGSGPFPPPFSGRRRVGGTIPEEETAQGRTGLGRSARGPGTPGPERPPSGSLEPRPTGRRVPGLSPLSGPTNKPLASPAPTPDPRASTYAEESRVHLAASLGDRSLSQGAPRRRDGGRDRPKGAQRRDAARAATHPPPPLPLPRACGCACSVCQESATRAQSSPRPRSLAKRGWRVRRPQPMETGGRVPESPRPTLPILLWRVIGLARAAGVDPSFDP